MSRTRRKVPGIKFCSRLKAISIIFCRTFKDCPSAQHRTNRVFYENRSQEHEQLADREVLTLCRRDHSSLPTVTSYSIGSPNSLACPDCPAIAFSIPVNSLILLDEKQHLRSPSEAPARLLLLLYPPKKTLRRILVRATQTFFTNFFLH